MFVLRECRVARVACLSYSTWSLYHPTRSLNKATPRPTQVRLTRPGTCFSILHVSSSCCELLVIPGLILLLQDTVTWDAWVLFSSLTCTLGFYPTRAGNSSSELGDYSASTLCQTVWLRKFLVKIRIKPNQLIINAKKWNWKSCIDLKNANQQDADLYKISHVYMSNMCTSLTICEDIGR